MLVWASAAHIPRQLPAIAAAKAMKDGSRILAPANHAYKTQMELLAADFGLVLPKLAYPPEE